MSDVLSHEDRRLQTEIDELRAKFADTQELYREVCTLLFFRHGITPTANKLYQLVRKGSMSAPADALSRFWETLREKSRVRIEHPDLPAELGDAAGEVIGALWQRAQALARDSVAAQSSEAQAAVVSARAEVDAAVASAEAATKTLAQTQEEWVACQASLQERSQALAREQGIRTTIERQLAEAAEQRRELQRAVEEARHGFEKQLEEQRLAAQTAAERHQTDLKRVRLEVDRERTTVGRQQKDLEQARRALTEQGDRHRADVARLQQGFEAQSGPFRQKLGDLESALAEARGARDALRQQLDKALLAKPPTRTAAKKPRKAANQAKVA
jgi:chromosome segregation ATPase